MLPAELSSVEFGEFAGAYELCGSSLGVLIGRPFSVEFSVESGGAFGSFARVFGSLSEQLSLSLASAFPKFSGSVGISVEVFVQLCWTVFRSSHLVWNVPPVFLRRTGGTF